MDPLPGDDGREVYAASAPRGRGRGAPMHTSERLALLRFELPRRVEVLRITGEEWPPPPPPPEAPPTRRLGPFSPLRRRAGGAGGWRGPGSPSAGAGAGAGAGAASIASPGAPSPQPRRRNIVAEYCPMPVRAGHGGSVEDAIAARYPRSSQKRAAMSFLLYWHKLQCHPRVDMAMFANVKVLVVDGVAPEWIDNLHLTRGSLNILRVERSCMSNVPAFLYPVTSKEGCGIGGGLGVAGEGVAELGVPADALDDSHVAELDRHRFGAVGDDEDTPLSVERGTAGDRSYPYLSHLRLSRCAIGELSWLGKDGGERDYEPPLSLLRNLESLDLSRNELVHASTACAGLKDLSSLSAVDLSYNRISSMKSAFIIFGNIKTLVLSRNSLRSVCGLDRLTSLERLALDYNNISQLQNIAGLGRLPDLMHLEIKGNPVEINGGRVDLLNVFKEIRLSLLPRRATFRQLQEILPAIDGSVATPAELLKLRELSFFPSMPVFSTDEGRSVVGSPRRNEEEGPDFGDAIGPTTEHSNTSGPGCNNTLTTDVVSVVSFGRRPRVTRSVLTRRVSIRNPLGSEKVGRRPGRKSKALKSGKNVVTSRHHLNNDSSQSPTGAQFSVEDVISTLVPRISDEGNGGIEIRESVDLLMDSFSSSSDEYEEDNEDEETSFGSREGQVLVSPFEHNENTAGLDRSEISRKMESIATAEIAHSHVDLPTTTNSLEDKEKLVVEGTESPVRAKSSVIASEGSDVIPVNDDAVFLDLLGPKRSDGSLSLSEDKLSGSIESDSEDKPIDYGEAEKASEYDGPEGYATLTVSSYLVLYFQTFVFPPSLHSDESFYDENYKGEHLSFPRIQLYNSDRDLAKVLSRSGAVTAKEKFLEVWKEDILACGIASSSRLPPTEVVLRGFHGEIVRDRGVEQKVSECQSLVLCLSDSALYFFPDFSIPRDKERVERRFPGPLPSNAVFGDALWFHAIARHPLECLQRITIGFQFQKVVLHFVLPVQDGQPHSFEFTYVAFTGSKLHTISLVQKLQVSKAALALQEQQADLVIDNEDKLFLDLLAEAIDPAPLGAVLHYQVLRQRWKNPRLDGTDPQVRRVCILTDSNIFLLNENYVGDGSRSSFIAYKGGFGDVALDLVDSAQLSQVSDIRAADEDPKQITLVITTSRLARSHRWRLVCSNGDSAEQLIADLRRAVAMVQ